MLRTSYDSLSAPGELMRTTVNIDDALFEKIMQLVKARTKTEGINRALAEFVRLKAKDELLSLRGQLELEDNWKEIRKVELKDE